MQASITWYSSIVLFESLMCACVCAHMCVRVCHLNCSINWKMPNKNKLVLDTGQHPIFYWTFFFFFFFSIKFCWTFYYSKWCQKKYSCSKRGFVNMNFYFFQVEFVGGLMCWNSRLFSATAGERNFPNFHHPLEENKNKYSNLFFCQIYK